MDRSQNAPRDIDAYIRTFPEGIRTKLEEMRRTIRKAAPKAEETIRYQIPTFRLNGNLVHFAAFRKHIGFYPAASGIAAFKKELSVYQTGKGSVQFPLDQKLPLGLVRKIVMFRLQENLETK